MLTGSFALSPKHTAILTQFFFIVCLSVLAGLAIELLLKKTALNSRFQFLSRPLESGKQAAVFASCAVLLLWFFQTALKLWENTDDFYISCVTNSVYAEDNYCYFISPVIAWLVKLIDAVLPMADGRIVLNEIFVLAGLWCVFHILSRSFSLGSSVTTLLLVMAINNKLNLLHQPFTAMTSEFFCFGFFILYAIYSGKAGKWFSVIGTVLLAFSCMGRPGSFLLGIPFALLILLADRVSEKKDGVKKTASIIKLLLPAVIICVILSGVKLIVDTGEKYGPGVLFSEERGQLVDYPKKSYDECRDAFEKEGVSENDYEAVKTMILADTDAVSFDYLRKINDISSLSLREKLPAVAGFGKDKLLGCINYSLVLQLIAMAIVVLTVLLSEAEAIRKWEVVFACAGAVLIFVFFIFLGHMRDYVTQALVFGLWLVLLAVFLNNEVSFRYGGSLKKIAFCAAVILEIFLYPGVRFFPENSALFARDTEIAGFAETDSSEESVYIWGVYDFSKNINKSDFVEKGKLLSEKFISHNLVDGDWMYSQPYYLDYLRRIGMEKPMKALIDREQTYYVAKEDRCALVLNYLREHFDTTVTADSVGEICGLPVWKFLKTEKE